MADAVTLLARGEALLGEGPCWDEARGRLYWVDIKSRRLHFWSAGEGARHMSLPIGASALGVRTRGGLIVVGDRTAGVVDVDQATFEPRLSFEPDCPNNRSNDGGVGADGRFWFGTMDDDAAAGCGALYSIDTAWTLTCVLKDLSIPNAILTSADGKTLFCGDTATGAIFVHDLDPATGVLSPRRAFATLRDCPGGPDGAALDEEGGLWVSIWDGWRVIRFAPDGTVEREIMLPVARPTSCAFGGRDHKTLFVTSARVELDEQDLAAQPLAGSVFSIDVGVRGVEIARFSD